MSGHLPPNSARRRTLLAGALILLLPVLTLSTQQTKPTFPVWTPPANRAKAKTPFEPRPLGGDNIFKGEAERWLADAIAEVDSSELLEDKDVTAYVARVGQNLVAYSTAPRKAYEFLVTTDDDANAWTAGSGRVYIHLGMLRAVESEDELAGVLAHEIAHDAFGHAPKTVTRQLFWMTSIRKIKSREEVEKALEELFAEYEKKPAAAVGEKVLGFSRFDELEADRAAFYTVYKAGYNPRTLGAVLKRMEREVKAEMSRGERARDQFLTLLFSSHPPTSQRTLGFSWESNFIKMPPKESRHASAAFDMMKSRVKEK